MAPIHRMGAPLTNQIKTPRFITLFIACKHKRKFERLSAVYTWLLTNLSHAGVRKEKNACLGVYLIFQPWFSQP